MATDKLTMKNRIIYNCEKCDFTCYKKSEWERHIETKKHIKTVNNALNNDKNAEIESLTCKNCNKFYKCRTGLWRHHKKYENNTCIKPIKLDEKSEMKTLTNLVLELVKNNSELQILGDGHQRKPFIHILDIISAINLIINNFETILIKCNLAVIINTAFLL